MKKLPILPALLSFLSVAPMAHATDTSCPATLEISESAEAPEGNWSIVKDEGRRGHFLESISIYAGHPGELANLVPDRTTSSRTQRKYIWLLPESASAGYWVACSYSNSLLMLTRPLAATVRRCELTEQRLPSGARLGIVSFVCQ